MKSAVAILVADSIKTAHWRSMMELPPYFFDQDEVFYRFEDAKYLYVLRYGVLCFYNFEPAEMEQIIDRMQGCLVQPKATGARATEQLQITVDAAGFRTGFDEIVIQNEDPELLRMTMLNLSQSVALAQYADISEKLLEDTRSHTTYLESKGRLDISGRKLKKYIGKVLNVKNQISENLYIFDLPAAAWEDEALNKVNEDLKSLFDLKDRYHTVNQRLNIVQDNLELFKDIMFHKESSKLEWIIILLILVEVVDLFVLKLF